MLYDDSSFLHSVAHFAAAQAALQVPPVTFGYGAAAPQLWTLFANVAVQAAAADPYAVLRTFGGGGERNNPKPTLRVQLSVTGSDTVRAKRLCRALHEAIVCDAVGRERRMQPIPGYAVEDDAPDGHWMIVHASTLNLPGQLGRDEMQGRVNIISTFELSFYKVAA